MAAQLDTCPTSDFVVEAIRTLYHHADPKEKEKASIWLQTWQKSVFAWQVSDELLHRKVDLESCYMAAQTLRTKVQTSFHELPVEAKASLRDSVLEHFNSIDQETPHVISTQLCLALADLMLQMPEWKGAVAELIQRYAQTRNVALLELLIVLPEEVNSRHLRLGANRRSEVVEDLRSSAEFVTQFLRACLTAVLTGGEGGTSRQCRINLLKCLGSWIELGVVALFGLESDVLMGHAFVVLESPGEDGLVHEAAVDCVCGMIERMEDLDISTPAVQFELTIFTLIRRLEPAYHAAVTAEDMNRALNLCRVFTEFGESSLLRILMYPPQSPHFAIGVFDSVLAACAHPDYEIPGITFNLWHRLSEELYQRDQEATTVMFRPYINRLILALCKHCQMEPDMDHVLEEGEDFSLFRQRVTELIGDVVFIVGSSCVFKSLFDYVKGAAAWEVMEAALFIMSAVAKSVHPKLDENVGEVVDSILTIEPSTHVAVRHTSLRLIGELAEWIDSHPQYLERILNWLLMGLQESKVASEAATALQNVCAQCRGKMMPHFQGLVQILNALDSFSLKPEAANVLIKGVVIILSDLPPDQIAGATSTLCHMQLGPLAESATSPTAGAQKIPKNSKGDPVLYLDRLSSIFRHITPNVPENQVHPCLGVIQETWLVVSHVCHTFQLDVRVMESACRTLRFMLRCVGAQATSILEPLAKMMVTIYQVRPHSCFLYLGSILVDVFSSNAALVSGLLGMMEAFLPPTFQLLQAENGLRNHPDTVDDFFRLNARFLQRTPVPFLRSNFMASIMECGLLAVYLDHRDANASVMKFYFDLFHAGRSKEDKEDYVSRLFLIDQIRHDFGAKILEALVRAAVFNLPSYTFHDIGDVVFELMLLERTSVCHWLEAALKTLPLEDANGIVKVTRKQLVKFHKDATTAEESKDVADAIRDFNRLWR
eukprot:maker-scaffold183_size276960-snap-gene-1.22 protein:Tk01756 transcript:maker-scaffold183_size276960-snap-gene-1.22-mRNA-1 annotation:"Transportin-3"